MPIHTNFFLITVVSMKKFSHEASHNGMTQIFGGLSVSLWPFQTPQR